MTLNKHDKEIEAIQTVIQAGSDIAKKQPFTQDNKSQLAKLLATENIRVQHNSSCKVPNFNLKDRILELPVWDNVSEDLYDMLVVHETGHALHTPLTGWVDAIKKIAMNVFGNEKKNNGPIHHFLNVVEDVRIDRLQKVRYPGSRYSYVRGYKELFQRNYFGTKNRHPDTYNLIDRINIHFKSGTLFYVSFSKTERNFVSELEKIKTWDEVVDITERIYRYAKDQHDKNSQSEPQIPPEMMEFLKDMMNDQSNDQDQDSESESGSGSSGGEGVYENEIEDKSQKSEDDDSEGDDKESSDGDNSEDSDSKSESDSKDSSDSKSEGENSEQGSDGQNKEGDLKDDGPDSETQKEWEKKQENLVSGNLTDEYVYATLPKYYLSTIVDDYKVVMKSWNQAINRSNRDAQSSKNDFFKYKQKENQAISFMVKEFEMRKAADEFARTSIAKTGVIDTNKLHAYKFSEDIFRRLNIVSTGKNHGFVMFLDWSCSMDRIMKGTIEQLTTLVMFCKRVQIPFEVYIFRSGITYSSSEDYGKQFDFKDGDIQFGQFKVRNILSSRMTTPELNTMLGNLWFQHYRPVVDHRNGTPLQSTILIAEQLIKDFQKRNRVQIVNAIFLTDGDSNAAWGISGKNLYQKRLMIEDNHKSYDVSVNQNGSDNLGHSLTITMLKILKDRTGCNLLGFFLTSSYLNDLMRYSPNQTREQSKLINDFWERNGFIPLKQKAGYDEYYIVKSHALNVSQNDFAEKFSGKYNFRERATVEEIESEFKAHMEKKVLNRVLLRRFIGMIISRNTLDAREKSK